MALDLSRRGGRARSVAVALVSSLVILTSIVGPAAAADPLPPLDPPPALEPIDEQNVTQAVDQTWDDYHPIPGSPYADPSILPTITRWKVALILTDFPGTPFAITQPEGSTIFGNPGPLAHDIPRDAVPAFYRDWMNTPSAINEFQGMNRYWMEDTYGKYGVQLEGYGPYELPGSQDDYFITDFTNNSYCNTQTRTTTAQSNVTDVQVVSSASFPIGKIVTGLSGSRVILEKPDATHLRTGGATTMPAASAIGATNIKFGSAAGLAMGHTIQIGYDDRLETRTIVSVGATGTGTGSGLNLDAPLDFAHATNTIIRDQVATPITVTASSFVHSCNRTFRTDTLVAWTDHVSATERGTFTNTFYVSAGQDESGTWQEFGEMRFTQSTVPDEFGPPNPEIPQNWAGTRYIPWTSWVSAATNWPNASGNNSLEGEGSGMAVYAHELTHNLGIGDNYNNPYAAPFQRTATGYLSMMSRGSFGGPGGTHNRWRIPSTMGTALGSQHVLRDKIKLGFVAPANFLDLNRNGLATSGLVVLDIMAREVNPGASGQTGVRINLDGTSPQDKNVSCTTFTTTLAAAAAAGAMNVKVASVSNVVAGIVITVGTPSNGETRTVASVGTAGAVGTGVTLTEPLTGAHASGEDFSNRLNCSGTANFNNYSLEVVQQIGSDSFQADSGILIEKNKTSESSSCGSFTCFAYVIDAHPEDINIIDFTRPDATFQQVTTGDPRQLADAMFHAGLNSGSLYEWEETRNLLHFYIIDRHLSPEGVLSYTVAIQNITGQGPHTRGTQVDEAPAQAIAGRWTTCTFPLTNTGVAGVVPGSPHPENASAYLNNDVYRLSTSVDGAGWQSQLSNALATASYGQTIDIPVYVTRDEGSAASATVSLTATSVSDPTKTSTATCAASVLAPTIGYTLDPASPNGSNGWYKSGDIDLTWQIQDATAIVAGCDDETFAVDGIFDRSCTASSDGGTTGPVDVTVMRDVTAPNVAVTGVSDGAVYVLGTTPATGCSASDATSGLDSQTGPTTTGGPIVGFFSTTCTATDVAGNYSEATANYQVIYDWSGFTGPLANPPTVNTVKAGSGTPLKFNLAGNQGLAVFAAGYPKFQATTCSTGAAIGNPVSTVSAEPFYYDALQQSYVYAWKSDKAQTGCGRIDVMLIDGTTHSALIKFK